jgi:helix-turn-helix protein
MQIQNAETPELSPASDYWDGLIDETTAADFVCQSIRTLQKWRVTGFGPPHYKSGRSVRYRRRDLMEWSDSRRRNHTSEA